MKYQRCNRCVMDTSDPLIVFDKNGNCNHCNGAIINLAEHWKRDGEYQLIEIFDKVKQENKDNQYDCIIGISGGVDSSYVAYLGHRYGLRMLGLHVDAGWNTSISEKNIQKICDAYNVDLVTEKINEREMMDLQKAYFLAGVPNQDVPQDHAFFCALYKYAIKHHVKYVLAGMNLSSECIIASYFSYNNQDFVNLLDIHKKYGKISLCEYPVMDYNTFFKDIPNQQTLSVLNPLNMIDYNKNSAISFLNQDCGFEYYGGKHLESIFTRLFQNYIQPKKFGHDKRTAHYSSLIVSGQMTREEALRQLDQPSYGTTEELDRDIQYFIEKLGITREEFDINLALPPNSHFNFKVCKPFSLYTLAYHPIFGKIIVCALSFFQLHPKLKLFAKKIMHRGKK